MAKKDVKFIACYQKLEHGYMAYLPEWPGVVTEGDTLEECRELLIEAASEMADMYHDEGLKIPYTPMIIKPIDIQLENIPEITEVFLENVG